MGKGGGGLQGCGGSARYAMAWSGCEWGLDYPIFGTKPLFASNSGNRKPLGASTPHVRRQTRPQSTVAPAKVTRVVGHPPTADSWDPGMIG